MAIRHIILPALLIGLVGCGDDGSGPDTPVVPESELVFARFSPDLTGRIETEGSFWAKRGDGRQLVLRYLPLPGESEGEDFLVFEVPGDALYRSPSGHLYAQGDSVLITVKVDTSGRMLFDFQPSGLRFHPDHPARLEVSYRESDDDVDGDGDHDVEDDSLRSEFEMWRQERAGLPWENVGSVRIEEMEELKADILGFTGFAVATRTAR